MQLYKDRPETLPGYEWCPGCKSVWRKEQFAKSSRRSNGRQLYCRDCTKEYRKLNALRRKEKAAEYYQQNSSRIREQARQYRLANPEYASEYFKVYRQTLSGKAVIRNAQLKYEERLRDAGPITPESLKGFEAITHCIYCKQAFVPEHNHPREKTLEHLIPLSRGGSNEASNLSASCRQCNVRKGTNTHGEFLEVTNAG